MTDDDLVTYVLVGASLAGPAILIATNMAADNTEVPDGTPGSHVVLRFVGGLLTFVAWVLLAGWWWLSNTNWAMF